MILLVGECGGARRVEELRARGWGRMWVTRFPRIYDGEPWGFDNGAYVAWRRGEAFPEGLYAQRLERAAAVGRPYLAIVPDLVGEGRRSLDFSVGWRARLRDDWPWYLAAQDGMDPAMVAKHLHRFAGIFLGGTDRFKREAARWAAVASEYGIGFHYGRASRFERLEHALEIGATSADTTNFMWTMKKWRRLLDWWDDSRLHQHHIFRAAVR